MRLLTGWSAGQVTARLSRVGLRVRGLLAEATLYAESRGTAC
jgi:hypothetical protein